MSLQDCTELTQCVCRGSLSVLQIKVSRNTAAELRPASVSGVSIIVTKPPASVLRTDDRGRRNKSDIKTV